jgi:hypothetical protein
MVALACPVVVLLGCASDAHAAVGWLERLSGPGPFFGVMVPLTLRCDPITADGHGEGGTGRGGAATDSRATGEAVGGGQRFDCTLPTAEQRPRTKGYRLIGVEFWRLWTDQNQLPYENEPVDRGVQVTAALGTLEYQPARQFKVGAGAGVAWFTGDAFDTFARPLVQPIRASIAPLALLKPGDRWLEFLKIYVNGNVLLGGVDAHDFGATGDFKAPFELQWQTTIAIDPWALWKK